jgi:AcrR family transcriptional regulator
VSAERAATRRGRHGRPRPAAGQPPARRGRGRPALDIDDGAVFSIAAETFGDRGVAATSMEVVAERCGVAKTTLHDRFGSKTAFVARVVEHERQRLAERLIAAYDAGAADRTPGAQIRNGYVAFFTYALERPATFRLLFGEAASEGTGRQARTDVTERITQLVADRFTAGGLRLGASAAVIASVVVGAGEAAARLMAGRPELDIDATTDLVADLVTNGIRGVAVDHLLAVDRH